MDRILDYFKGDDLASHSWLSKYALRDKVNNLVEETPDDMHRRMAKEVFRIENDYCQNGRKNYLLSDLSPFGQILVENNSLSEEEIYSLFKDFKFIIPGGSVMSLLGNPYQIGSLSNCFVIGQPDDSYGSIMKKRTEQVQLMKRRGGVGKDLSLLRPKGAFVNNAAKTSTGPISFMEVDSEITREVAQEGRRGALMETISIIHPDSDKFITSKLDTSKITGANISVKLTDEFMEAVAHDTDFIQRFPIDFKDKIDGDRLEYNVLTQPSNHYQSFPFVKKIHASELWKSLVHSSWKSAEPGIMFENRHHDYSPDGTYPNFKGVTTNPCFSYETKILTAHGYEKIGDLEGQDIDFVNKDGKIVSGTVFKSGKKSTYTLNLSNKETIVTTIDHRFMLTDGSEKQAQFITKEDRLMPFFIINDKINEFVKYGFIQGDGCTGRLDSTAHLGIEVNIGEKDEDIAKLFNVKITGKIYLGGFNDILKELGFDSSVLPNRTLPTTFYNWSSDNKLMFLKGLWSANGSIIKGHRISFKSTCKELILELSNILQEFGIDNYFTTNKAREVEFSNGIYLCKESYDLNISKYKAVLKFAENIGFVHNYKQDSLKELILTKAPKILSAKVTEVKPVYDFSLNDDTHWGVIQGVIAHNCGEIFMQPYDSCRLIHINLTAFVKNPFTKDAEFDYESLYKTSYLAMRIADDLIDLEIEAIGNIIKHIWDSKGDNSDELHLWSKIEESAREGRRAGVGFTGLADVFAMMGFTYGKPFSQDLTNEIMYTKLKGELDCTIDLAISRGTFEGYKPENEYYLDDNDGAGWNFSHFDKNSGWVGEDYTGKNTFYQFLIETYPEQVKRMLIHGRRNISWSTVAPTGTVSILARVSSGIEPIFLPYYERSKKCMNESDRVDFVDETGEKFTKYFVLHPMFEQWILMQNGGDFKPSEMSKETLDFWYKGSPWNKSDSASISWQERVELQAIVQRYTTHSISSTVNLPKETSEELISEIYMNAWHRGLKGITVYRDGSRDGILNSVDKVEYPTGAIIEHSAPKRPKVLPADLHVVTSNKVKYAVVVGLLDNKPYEVFAFEFNPLFLNDIKSFKGTITKVRKGKYKFESEHVIFENLQLLNNERIEEKSCTLYTSMLLRHGASIPFIIKTARKVNDGISSFSSAMCRVLSKYVPKEVVKGDVCPECGGEMIREAGCTKCTNCGHSHCLLMIKKS